MAFNTSKYRYGKSVVEVRRIIDLEHGARFQCLVRGYGQNNKEPRDKYIIEAETPAAASRNALQQYRAKYGQEKQ